MISDVSEKWKVKTKELFDFFCEKMTQHQFKVQACVHPIYDPQNVRELYRYGAKDADVKEVIEFAILNWDQIRKIREIGRTNPEPNFRQIVSQFKFPTLFQLCKQGLDSALEKEPDIEESDGFTSDKARRLFECSTKK